MYLIIILQTLKLLDDKEKELKKRIIPFYIGDDKTDEDAFRALGKKGYTVKVGSGPTLADYYLKGTSEVIRLLKDIFNLKKEEAEDV